METEIGGRKVYKTALRCVQNPELKQESKEYLEQTERHVQIVQEISSAWAGSRVGHSRAPGRAPQGKALVEAMEMALKSGPPAAAELVAAEGSSRSTWGMTGKLLEQAFEEVMRRTSIFITPPAGPESSLDPVPRSASRRAAARRGEDVKTAIGAARAKQFRKNLFKK